MQHLSSKPTVAPRIPPAKHTAFHLACIPANPLETPDTGIISLTPYLTSSYIPNVEWLRDDLGLIDAAEATDALAASVASTDGVTYVPALLGLGTPQWDFGVRDPPRHHAGQHPGPHRARRARGRRPPWGRPRGGGRGRHRCASRPGPRRRRDERQTTRSSRPSPTCPVVRVEVSPVAEATTRGAASSRPRRRPVGRPRAGRRAVAAGAPGGTVARPRCAARVQPGQVARRRRSRRRLDPRAVRPRVLRARRRHLVTLRLKRRSGHPRSRYRGLGQGVCATALCGRCRWVL